MDLQHLEISFKQEARRDQTLQFLHLLREKYKSIPFIWTASLLEEIVGARSWPSSLFMLAD